MALEGGGMCWCPPVSITYELAIVNELHNMETLFHCVQTKRASSTHQGPLVFPRPVKSGTSDTSACRLGFLFVQMLVQMTSFTALCPSITPMVECSAPGK